MTPRDADFERDPAHWLFRLSPEEWTRAALAELSRAQLALSGRDRAAGFAGLKRAAGMALNAALIVRPEPRWGRSYVDHLRALASDEAAPAAVRAAALELCGLKAPGGPIVTLTTAASNARLLEAAKTVMAHAYALVYGSSAERGGD
jgi:HEPN domain-containing protein